jgi:hypothetical protein
VNATTVSAQDNELLLVNGGVGRWIPTAENRFSAKYTDQTMVFERNVDGVVTHMILNTPLGSLRRMNGIDSPRLQRVLLAAVLITALLTIVGYGYRGWQRASGEVRIPKRNVMITWIHCVLLIGLYGYLVMKLNGDVREFSYGMPPTTHAVILLMSANLLLGFVVIWRSGRHCSTGQGSTMTRVRYMFVALAAVINTWICWYFNIIAYLFQ